MKKFLFVLTILFIGCAPASTTPNQINPTIPSDVADCPAACTNLKRLHCPEGDDLPPSPDNVSGTTCAQFCQITEQSGHNLRPSLLKNAKSCEEVIELEQ